MRGTLKITSAMKLIASSKLRKAQDAIGNMLPYQEKLHSILMDLLSMKQNNDAWNVAKTSADGYMESREVKRVAVVACSSNSSLCGAFNENAIRIATGTIESLNASGISSDNITVFSIGRKMSEAMKKLGYPSPADYTGFADRPTYDEAVKLSNALMNGFLSGKYDKVELVYNHYLSTASQKVVCETYLPLSFDYAGKRSGELSGDLEYIVEPGVNKVIDKLLPKVMSLKIFSMQLDASAAEHAARVVAMQTATDNGNTILQELTLQYNKGRQQKITNEILDIVGGSMQ